MLIKALDDQGLGFPKYTRWEKKIFFLVEFA